MSTLSPLNIATQALGKSVTLYRICFVCFVSFTKAAPLDPFLHVTVGFVGVEHTIFCLLETWLWRTKARAVFRTKKEDLTTTGVLAAQQGVYNLFLAMGCFLSIAIDDPIGRITYPTCCLFAASFGCTSAFPTIFLFQGVPALIATTLAVVSYDQQVPTWLGAIYGISLLLMVVGYIWKVREATAKASEGKSA
jgi:putative membrane protein